MKRTFALQLRCLPLLGLCAGVLFAGASGCAGDLDPSLLNPETADPSTPCDAPTMVFKAASCTACHGTATSAVAGAGLDLESSGFAMRLVGKGPNKDGSGGAMCMSGTKPYLVANTNPPDGLLLDKTDPQKYKTLENCGNQMPTIGGPLSAAQLTCLSSWAAGIIAGTAQ